MGQYHQGEATAGNAQASGQPLQVKLHLDQFTDIHHAQIADRNRSVSGTCIPELPCQRRTLRSPQIIYVSSNMSDACCYEAAAESLLQASAKFIPLVISATANHEFCMCLNILFDVVTTCQTTCHHAGCEKRPQGHYQGQKAVEED